MKLSNYVQNVVSRAENIIETFGSFSDGSRMLMLMQREKDGGSHHEERRNLCTRFTFNKDQFKRGVEELLFLMALYPNSRIYMNLNKRNLPKVIRQVERELLDLHYCGDEEIVRNTQQKLIRSPRHFFMQPNVRDESMFLIDVDDEPGKDIMGEVLTRIAELKIEEVMRYKTKNGWHVVVKPFNPGLWEHKSEIKKDPLVLLAY